MEGYDNKAYETTEPGLNNTADTPANKKEGEPFPRTSDTDLPNRKVLGDDELEEDLRCGLGSCKPDCLQTCNNPKAVLVWLCWLSFLQGFMVNGINNVNTTTLERRFQLSSSAAGSISSSYDISAAILSIPVSYFGAHAHQPRMLTFAAFIMSCGAFVMSIPHFATGPYELQDSQADECIIGVNATSCSDVNSNISMWLGVFILGMILNGVGGTILYSVGIVFLDSNVSASSSPLYQGFLYASATLGPAVGYLLGGYIVESLYVDIDVINPDEINISPEDPRFVGAWWIGFLATGVLMLTVVVMLMCYPKELPSAKAARAKRKLECHDNGSNEAASREGFGKSWRDMPEAFKILVKNPVYMFGNLAGICEGLIVSAVATFMPKFIQNQFGLTAGFAAIVGGACAVPGAAGGQFVGGLVSKLAKLSVKGMLRMNIITSILAAITSTVLLSRCSAPDFAGINQSHDNSSIRLKDVNLTGECNDRCKCTTFSYEPICGIDGIQYFTPCHAGCQSMKVNGTKIFVNCSCIIPTVPDNDYVSMAVEGTCDTSCQIYYVFLPFFFLVIFFVFMAAVPLVTVTLRCVPDSQRSFALGLQWVFVRFLGSIPGPILMGYVFDSTCIVWQEFCGERGSCWVYDNRLLSLRLMIMTAVIKVASTIFFFIAYKLYKPPAPELVGDNKEPVVSFNDIKPNGNIDMAPSLHNLPKGYVPYVKDDAIPDSSNSLDTAL